jgi:hypothetical protein
VIRPAFIRLTTSRSAYRRAGLVIGTAASPTLLSADEFGELGHDRVAKLLADAAVEIAASEDGVSFKRVPMDERQAAVVHYQEFMTGTGEEGGADSQTPLEPSLAPGAAAAQGDDASKTETEAATPPSGEEQPAADSAPAPVAAPASEPEKPSGRASKAAKPKASEAKAAS